MLTTYFHASQSPTVHLLVHIRDAKEFQRIKAHLEQTRNSIVCDDGIIELK